MIDRVSGHLFDKDREQLRQRMSDKARGATGNGEVIDLRERLKRPVT